MIDKEIEEQAEDYELDCTADVYKDDVCTIPYAYSAQKLEQAFKDGAKWGMEHQWHDLRKNPNDLPKCEEKQQIVFYVKEFNTDIEKDTSHFCLGFFAKSFMNDDIKVFIKKSKGYECEYLSQEVIKWCELPQFKDKE